MPTAEIRIEGKPVYFFGDTGQDHLYLVLVEADGIERVLRAGPAGTFGTGPIRFEISVPMLGSADGRLPEDRDRYGSRVLDLGGRAAEDVWEIMVQQARMLDRAAVPFQLYSENSNSSIGALLHVVGLDVAQVLPDQPNRIDSYPGLGSILDRFAVELTGGAGDDLIRGGRAADRLEGGDGADTLGGGAGADRLSGGAGGDFLNGGWGPDRLTGGAGADRFYHAGPPGHGCDWISDFTRTEGDALVFGAPARPDQFQVIHAHTPGAGSDGIDEAFVIWRPTGQILWALTDGAAQGPIALHLATGVIGISPPMRQDAQPFLMQVMEPAENPPCPWPMELKEAGNMTTAYLNSQFFNILSKITTASDPTAAVLGMSFDNLAALQGLGDVLDGQWVAGQMTSSRVVLTQADVTLTIDGAGLAPLTSAGDFLSGIFAGTTTGTLTGIRLQQAGTELLGMTLTASSLTVTSGNQSIDLTGVLPTTFSTLPALLGIASLLDIEALAGMDADDRAALVAQLTPYDLSGLALRDGATTVASLTLGSTGMRLLTPTLVLEIGSDAMPANLGALAQQIFAAAGPGDTNPIFLLLEALAVEDARLATTTGVELLRLDGVLGGSDPLQIVLDGVALPAGTPLLVNLTALGTTLTATDVGSLLVGTAGLDSLTGGIGNDTLLGLDAADRLAGGPGADRLLGGDGSDTLDGGAGDDFIFGGATAADLRDVIYGGDGHDNIDGGAGNDELNGGNGNDTVQGGLGSDTVIGNAGNDMLAGAGGSDLIYGGPGNDVLNGGFGFDRLNGGTGADSFYHLGVADHGSDWIQDYTAAEGDILTVGIAGATRAQFQVNTTFTPGAGSAAVAEAFVIYRPTGQILWALVDGGDDAVIHASIGGQVFDLVP